MFTTTRRGFVRIAGVSTAGAFAWACAPAAAPPPAAPAAPAAAPAQPPTWQAEWERVLAEAKKEGTMAIVTRTGVGFRKPMDAFEAAHPGIKVELRQFSTIGQSVPVVMQERKAGIFTFDLVEGSPTISLGLYRPEGAIDSLKPLLIRPDVRDDKSWANGFDAGWMDNEKQLAYAFGAGVSGLMTIDTDQVKPDEIKTARDLLNPKWKGKMLFADVRQGFTWAPMTSAGKLLGDDFVKKLITEQEITFRSDGRQIVEAAVRGQYPITLGLSRQILQEFVDKGLGKSIKFIDVEGLSYITNSSAISRFSRAPHPNATTVFLNWLLSKEGQQAWSTSVEVNSRRLDVPVFDQLAAPARGRKYYEVGPENGFAETDRMQKFLVDITK